MNVLPRCVTPVLLALLILPAQATEWIIRFDVARQKTTKVDAGKVSPPDEDRHHTETVVLGESYLVTDDGQQRRVFDFARVWLTDLTLATNIYVEGPLYPNVAFMEHELANRNMLGSAMRAAKIAQVQLQFDRFWNESTLHMASRNAPAEAPPPKIETVQAGAATEFRYNGEVVARFIPSTEKPPPALYHRFINYLAYQCDLHPQIRQAIADTGALPQELAIHGRNLNATSLTTLRLVSAGAAESDSRALPAEARLMPPAANNALLQVLATVDAAAAQPARPTLQEADRFADAAIAARRPLDALLALLEYSLSTGGQPAEAMNKHRDIYGSDQSCQTYLKAFDQSSKPAAERSLKLNQSLNRKNLTKAYMLDVQRANLLDATGHQGEAIQLFLGVLRANPYHTGALHDLGSLYARGYEEYNAWRCWDAARRLYPHHPMMNEVTQFERDLTVRQLDFF
jgi:hypothetical protein